jgi:hypothetical protein
VGSPLGDRIFTANCLTAANIDSCRFKISRNPLWRLHTLQFDLMQRTPYLAARQGSALVQRILMRGPEIATRNRRKARKLRGLNDR